MDEKTEELRDIFIDVTDSDTVTESQEETPGTLVDDEGDVRERVDDVIARLRERYAFETGLTDEELRAVAVRFFEGEDDGTVADALGVDPETVFLARTDLHLLRDDDAAGVDLDALGEHEGEDAAEVADALDCEERAVGRGRRVLATRDETRRANDRFRDEFEELLADGDLSGRLTEATRDDGLEDATEGMETDVSF